MRSYALNGLLLGILTLHLAISCAEAWDFDSITPAPSPPSAPMSSSQQVYFTFVRMTERWNAHDLEGYLDAFWKAPELVVVVESQQFTGWKELHDAYLRGYHDVNQMGVAVLTRFQVRMVRPDLAFALSYWTISFPNSNHVTVGMDSNYLQLFNNGWKIISGHSTTMDM